MDEIIARMKKRKSRAVLPVLANEELQYEWRRTKTPTNIMMETRALATKGFLLLVLLLAIGSTCFVLLRRSSTVLSQHAAAIKDGVVLVPANPSAPRRAGADEDRQLLHPHTTHHQEPPRPLDEFGTLSAQLALHDIVALYFAASWCPMSTPITRLLDELYRDILVGVRNNNNNNAATADEEQKTDFAVLYVSSDKDEASFSTYIQPGWQVVPFAGDERTRLKQQFRVCAKREMEELGLNTRDGELPTVLILDGGSRQVLTRNGIKDMKELGKDALNHWKELQSQSAGKLGDGAAMEMR